MTRRGFTAAVFAIIAAPAVVLAGPRRPRFPYLPHRSQARRWEFERRGNHYYRRRISFAHGPRVGLYRWQRCPWGLEQSLLRKSYLPRNYKTPVQSWWESYLRRREER